MSMQPTDSSSNRSRLSEGSRINGKLAFQGFVEIFGSVEGELSGSSVMVEQSSTFQGDLTADHVWIRGQFDGRIFGGAVTLHGSARITGEVVYDTLSIESGAVVDAAFRKRA